MQEPAEEFVSGGTKKNGVSPINEGSLISPSCNNLLPTLPKQYVFICLRPPCRYDRSVKAKKRLECERLVKPIIDSIVDKVFVSSRQDQEESKNPAFIKVLTSHSGLSFYRE